jgi:hypothetical protein
MIVADYTTLQKELNYQYSNLLQEASMELGEKETTITYDMQDKLVRIFTAVRRDQTRLSKAGIQPKYGNGRAGWNYQIPLSRFKWRISAANPIKREVDSMKPRKIMPFGRRKSST